jgi:hypothetical protein
LTLLGYGLKSEIFQPKKEPFFFSKVSAKVGAEMEGVIVIDDCRETLRLIRNAN